ncbi:MAG TPA: hypothetical protein VFC24_06210 [Casimicrobiaceae bacterium]|nr:hypothetical protein [Casimicrobiaceae bacterium]
MIVRALAVLALALACAPLPAQASFHLFRIDQVYSNSDGEVQYVVMREVTGTNGENFWGGQLLVSTNAAGQAKTLMFPHDLPSSATAGKSVLIATPGFAALGLVTPDYTIPARFIPTAGGTLDYASGIDHLAIPPLPSDGATAITRTGALTPATPKNFSNASAPLTSVPVINMEFYNLGLDHYFMSSLAADIDALDSGRIAGWTRTGQSFGVFPAPVPGVSPVCRILIPPPASSHFFSASPQECADTLAKFPFMTKETDAAFYVALPVTTGANAGACPAGTMPVYRVFNARADGNHRYTTDPAIRDQMVARGGVAEGYGPNSVIMCAVSPPAIATDTPVMPPPSDPPPPPPPNPYCMIYPQYCPP